VTSVRRSVAIIQVGIGFPIILADGSDANSIAKGCLDVDEDFFADHDERCHGPMDTEENRAEFPEGFNWDCCGGDALSEGCETGQHVTGGKFKKRR
jgi:hypothetical protein